MTPGILETSPNPTSKEAQWLTVKRDRSFEFALTWRPHAQLRRVFLVVPKIIVTSIVCDVVAFVVWQQLVSPVYTKDTGKFIRSIDVDVTRRLAGKHVWISWPRDAHVPEWAQEPHAFGGCRAVEKCAKGRLAKPHELLSSVIWFDKFKHTSGAQHIYVSYDSQFFTWVELILSSYKPFKLFKSDLPYSLTGWMCCNINDTNPWKNKY